jgi:hypothetical protein
VKENIAHANPPTSDKENLKCTLLLHLREEEVEEKVPVRAIRYLPEATPTATIKTDYEDEPSGSDA